MNLNNPIKSIMTSEVISVSQSTTLSVVRNLFLNHSIHHIPVSTDGAIVGLISRSDYPFFTRGYKVSETENQLYTLTAKDIMTKGLATLEPNDKIETALKIFKENLFHSIPVVKNGLLVGIVTTLDIITTVLDQESAVS